MRLISATVRNYRIHRDVTVEFDETLSLIGGPNESGKSTFAEAVHHGLFLKSRVTGDGHDGMVSTTHPGHPEVSVAFEAGGKTYKMVKQFAGNKGTTMLTEDGGASWQAEEAETKLAELLQVEDVGGGRGIGDRVKKQWAHLWVRQGQSGRDPSESAASEQARLLQRLQESGGAVTMQSEQDARVAEHFAKASEVLFTKGGKPKAGSDLEITLAAVDQAEARQQEAASRLERLTQAMRDYEDAEQTITQCTETLEANSVHRDEVKIKLTEVQQLRALEQTQASEAGRACDKYADLKKAEDKIAALRASTAELQAALEPEAKTEADLQQRVITSKTSLHQTNQAYEQSRQAAGTLRARRELARAWVQRFEKHARFEALEKTSKRVETQRAEIRQLQDELAKLPDLDAAGLKKIEKANTQSDNARIALDAMAAEIQVLAADKSVTIAGQEAEQDSLTRVSDPTDICIGDNVRIRIQPGGGNRLTEARDALRKQEQLLQELLTEHALSTVEEAADVVRRRSDILDKIKQATSRLEELDDGSLADELANARAAHAAAEAEVERKASAVSDAPAPADHAAAVQWRDAEDKAIEQVEAGEVEALAAYEAAKQAVGHAEAELQELLARIAGQKKTIDDQQAQLVLLIEDKGEDAEREKKLADAQDAKQALETALKTTQDALADLQPEQLEGDRDRYERVHHKNEEARKQAQEKRAECRAALRLDGKADPQKLLIEANVQLESAQDRLIQVQKKTEALKLLDTLFQEQQRALDDQFTRPLAEKITQYLRGVFGPDAEARVSFENGAFAGIDLVRPGQGAAVPFNALSGGASEQVAAAVRLAMAELLAAGHDGCLPVLFDDAFANSDPERVALLQRMLDLAGRRGLQVIVLSCNPAEYAGLGATMIPFRRATESAATPNSES